MSTLYELTSELKAALYDLGKMLNDKDITQDEHDDSLAGILSEHQVKSVGVIAHIKNIRSHAGALKIEIDRLQKLHKSACKSAEFYEGYLLDQMLKLDQTQAGEGVHTCKVKEGSMRCEITNIDDLPRAYVDTVMTEKVDKNVITRAIKAGEEIRGARLIAGPSTLKIN